MGTPRTVLQLGLVAVVLRVVLAARSVVHAAEFEATTFVVIALVIALLDVGVLLAAIVLTARGGEAGDVAGAGLFAAVGALALPAVIGALHNLGSGDAWVWPGLVLALVQVAAGGVAATWLGGDDEVEVSRPATPATLAFFSLGLVALGASLMLRLVPADLPVGIPWSEQLRIDLDLGGAAGQANLLLIVVTVALLLVATRIRPARLSVALAVPLVVGFAGQVIADSLLLFGVGDPGDLVLAPGVGYVALLGTTGALTLMLTQGLPGDASTDQSSVVGDAEG